MVHLIKVLLPVAILIRAAIAQNPKPLSRVFQVDLRDPSVYSSSCLNHFDANEDNPSTFEGKPIFDASKGFNDRNGNILNNIWWQMYTMVYYSRVVLAQSLYNFDAAKLLYSFWGIVFTSPSSTNPAGTPVGIHSEKLTRIQDRFQAVQNFMETEQPDGPAKYKIFCDGDIYEIQEADDLYKDRWGRQVIKSDTGEPWRLREWETFHGRDFDSSYYFWFDIESMAERGYYVIPEDDFDFQEIEGTAEYNVCGIEGPHAEVLLARNPPASASGGTDNWYKGGHVILCNSALGEDSPYDNLEKQPLGTKLGDRTIAAVTFLHELFHVVFPDPGSSDDQLPWLPLTLPNVATGTVSPLWPRLKSGFTRARANGVVGMSGPLLAWSLAMYELAYPPTLNIDQLDSWRTPEVYAQFGRAAWLLAQGADGGQDWSTGVARDLRSPFVGPTLLPPQAKRTAIPGEPDAETVETTFSMQDFWTTMVQRFESSNMTITELPR